MTNLEIYKSIPTYPDSVKVDKERTLAAEAPLCEDEHGNVSYISSEHRKKWLNTMYAKEQRIRNGKKKGRSDKDD
jgi:hypothetical protein